MRVGKMTLHKENINRELTVALHHRMQRQVGSQRISIFKPLDAYKQPRRSAVSVGVCEGHLQVNRGLLFCRCCCGFFCCCSTNCGTGIHGNDCSRALILLSDMKPPISTTSLNPVIISCLYHTRPRQIFSTCKTVQSKRGIEEKH